MGSFDIRLVIFKKYRNIFYVDIVRKKTRNFVKVYFFHKISSFSNFHFMTTVYRYKKVFLYIIAQRT